jgi:hypothetical protein
VAIEGTPNPAAAIASIVVQNLRMWLTRGTNPSGLTAMVQCIRNSSRWWVIRHG